jgi:uncharacterized protein
MGLVPNGGQRRVTPVVIMPYQSKIETNGEPGKPDAKNIHLDISRAGHEKQADQAEYSHHQPHDEITHTAFHLHLSCAPERKCRAAGGLTLIHINAVRGGLGHRTPMLESLQWLGAICTSDTALKGGLMFGLFAAGAAGSIVHCGPMCGAFVLGQVSDRMVRLPSQHLCERRRISNGLLVPYHLGRLTTYATLGALAAGSAALLGPPAWFARVSAILLATAALLFLTHALGRLWPSIRIDRAPRFWGRLIRTVTTRIPRGSAPGEFLFGLTLGFLPCGFLYAAIAAAAAAGPVLGAAAMVAFGLGTAPVLMVIGIAGQAAGRRWSRGVAVAAPAMMVLNAALLLALAWQRLT